MLFSICYSFFAVQPFAWDKHTTQLLVEQYMHLKDAFRDPKVKKKSYGLKLGMHFYQSDIT